MPEKVENYQIDRKYRVVFEKAAGVKSGDGFKVEANNDDIEKVMSDAKALYSRAKQATLPVEE